MERTFLEGSGKLIRGCADVPHRRETCPNRQALPIPVRFCLLLFGVCDPANCPIRAQSSLSLVKAEFCTAPFANYSQGKIFLVGKSEEMYL